MSEGDGLRALIARLARLDQNGRPLADTGGMSLGPQTYTKTLVTVTAMQYSAGDVDALRDWLGGERLHVGVQTQAAVQPQVWVTGDGLPGWTSLSDGDWVIQDDGEFCTAADVVFRRRYQLVVAEEITATTVIDVPGDGA